ncbi:MAG: N-acetylmuramoyl-L-alanine amidase [Lachnospiraceae bacterium]
MEEKIIKRFMLGMIALSIAICCGFMYLPGATRAAGAWMKEYRIMREEARKREEMTDLELLKYHEQRIEEDTREEIGDAIRMALPRESSLSEVLVRNIYNEHRIEIVFKGQDETLLERYPVVGSTKHIDDMEVFSDKDGLHVAFITDDIMEPVMEQKGQYCYLHLEDPRDLYEHILVVDAGHGKGTNPGATMEDAVEDRINLAIVKKLKKLLDEQDEIKVYYTRLNQVGPDLKDRVGLANEVQADIFISVHQNAMGNRYNTTNGTEVLYSQSDTSKPGSKKLARILLNHVTEKLGSQNRGLVKGDVIYIIRKAKMPVALVEVGFITNQEEKTNLMDEAYQQNAAQALYDGILEAFEKGF